MILFIYSFILIIVHRNPDLIFLIINMKIYDKLNHKNVIELMMKDV